MLYQSQNWPGGWSDVRRKKHMDNTKGFKAFEPGLVCKGKQYAENAA